MNIKNGANNEFPIKIISLQIKHDNLTKNRKILKKFALLSYLFLICQKYCYTLIMFISFYFYLIPTPKKKKKKRKEFSRQIGNIGCVWIPLIY